jgi:hypothetical protein
MRVIYVVGCATKGTIRAEHLTVNFRQNVRLSSGIGRVPRMSCSIRSEQSTVTLYCNSHKGSDQAWVRSLLGLEDRVNPIGGIL